MISPKKRCVRFGIMLHKGRRTIDMIDARKLLDQFLGSQVPGM
jgi:hypothetical protein